MDVTLLRPVLAARCCTGKSEQGLNFEELKEQGQAFDSCLPH